MEIFSCYFSEIFKKKVYLPPIKKFIIKTLKK